MATKKNNMALNITLWFVQGLVAFLFLMNAYMKLAMPIPELSAIYKWTGELSVPIVRLLGVIDLLGGVGIILPTLLKFKPWLTPLASVGIILLMISASIFHALRGEASVISFNIIVIFLAVFVAWGRYRKVPIKSNK